MRKGQRVNPAHSPLLIQEDRHTPSTHLSQISCLSSKTKCHSPCLVNHESTSHSKRGWKCFPLLCEEPLLTDPLRSQILMRTHEGGRKAAVNKVSKGCSAGFILRFFSTAVHHMIWKVIRHSLILVYFPKHRSSNRAAVHCFSATHKLHFPRV